MENQQLSIPNVFYDLIVFLTPTVVLAIGITVGFANYADLKSLTQDSGAIGLVLFILAFLAVSYEYGRLAEAWSATIIQRPIFFLQERLKWPRNENFGWAPDANILGLPAALPQETLANRWTFYYAAALVDKEIGSDLLKRYAWEKLARSSAFTYLLLGFASVAYGAVTTFTPLPEVPAIYGFGRPLYSAACGLLYLSSSVEYFRRNSWNMDLLHKILPVLKLAVDKWKTGMP